jgi:polyisoprenoid-binding protein YceI
MPQSASAGAATAPITYVIDPAHTTIDFKVRHLMVSNVRGEFSGVFGTVVYDPKNPANSKIEATIDATTIHTREPQRGSWIFPFCE